MKTIAVAGGLSRRRLLQAGGAGRLGRAQGHGTERGGAGRLLINEAVTADLSISMLALRYRAWADYLAPQLKMRSMLVDPIIDIRRFVQQALLEDKPMILFGKSVNQLSKLVRDHGYQPLVARSDPYRAAFIVPKDSGIRDLSQLTGRKLLMPDEAAATTAVAKAELRGACASPSSRTPATRTAWRPPSAPAWRKRAWSTRP